MSRWEDLSKPYKDIADKGKLSSASAAIAASKAKLLELGCTQEEISVIKELAEKLFEEQQSRLTVRELLRYPENAKWSRISFGCGALDRCSGGGIVTRGITEFCGASGVGKTQLLLQLSLMVQLPQAFGGLEKGVAFICTEDLFPSKRIHELSKSFEQRYPNLNINYLGNIFVECVLELEDLMKCITERLANLMATCNIGLIVIDSVAAIYRLLDNYKERATAMRKLANALLAFSEQYNCAVICVNQVTGFNQKSLSKSRKSGTIMFAPPVYANTDVPCLGLAWAHLGRTRIKISKRPKQTNIHGKLVTIRRFEILYSPDTPNEFAEFAITQHGVVDVL